MTMYPQRYKSHHDASSALKSGFEMQTDKKAYVARLLAGPACTRRAIYIHVPFCTKVCSFCPFHRPDELSRQTYDKYVISEIDRLGGLPYMEAPVDSVYFGGGTPTALRPEQMSRILDRLKTTFDIPEGTEISVETSVTELSDEMTQALSEGGVNRLSVGVQTFDDGGRRLLGRRGSGEAAAERLRKTLKSGFKNVGIDLIYNYPGETEEILARDIAIIRGLGLAGVSFYSLMLHEKTPIMKKISQADVGLMADTGRERVFFDMIADGLSGAGYEFFELTRMIRNGLDRYDYMRVRHSGGSCIAVGHGAGGNLDNYVYHNRHGGPLLGDDVPISAMGRVLGDGYFILDEFINDLQKMAVDLSEYSGRLGFDLEERLSGVLERATAGGLLERQGAGISLTRAGIFWGNNLIDEFIREILK